MRSWVDGHLQHPPTQRWETRSDMDSDLRLEQERREHERRIETENRMYDISQTSDGGWFGILLLLSSLVTALYLLLTS